MLKADIQSDFKEAMLKGDKRLVSILRSIKSAILYKEVETGKKEQGLDDKEIVAVLKKERKSRNDSLTLYKEAGEHQKADEEQYQIDVIERYLPEEMTEEEIRKAVEESIKELAIENPENKDMGRIIGAVKGKYDNVDGSMLAGIVKGIIA